MKRGFLILLCGILLAGCGTREVEETEGKVVAVQRAAASMEKYYESIDELLADSTQVVAGECVDTESFVADDNIVWTIETYKVNECLYGDIENGSTITIHFMGGNVKIKDYMESYNGIFKNRLLENYNKATQSNAISENDLISFVYGDDKLPEVGEKSVLFLTESTLEDNAYFYVGAFMGAFYLSPENVKSSGSEKMYKGYVGEYTLSEIREEIDSE